MTEKGDIAAIKARLESRSPLPPLHPEGVWDESLNGAIAASRAPELVKAGLYLLNDDLDRCHRIAQIQANPDGNYWHAILHRREGDFGNSKYWYRRTKNPKLIAAMREKHPGWDPIEFVDRCEAASADGGNDELLRIQLDEILFHLRGVGG